MNDVRKLLIIVVIRLSGQVKASEPYSQILDQKQQILVHCLAILLKSA